jgi:Domain of unknown function (DUF4190)
MPPNDDEPERPRARRSEDDNDEDDRPRARRRRDEEDDDDHDDRPRRRRRPHPDDDGTGGLIPYKNPKALAAYYCGVFGLISCFLGLGIFGILPIVFGVMGLKYAKLHPEAKGQAHAIIGIVLGVIEVVTFLAVIVVIIVAVANKK